MTHALRFWDRAPHLSAATLAFVSTALAAWIFLGTFRTERWLAHLTAPEMMDVKDQGLALQDEAFRDKDLLPIYGSSEFHNDTPYSGRGFFSTYPTGFGLFIVGKAGSKALISAQRIAALGNAVRGKKVVFILSPTWFISERESPASYDGNFSALQAQEFLFNSPISRALKIAIAREMLKYPETLVDHPLLRFELQRLAARQRTLEDRIAIDLGRSEDIFLGLLDHVETTFTVSEDFITTPRTFPTPAQHAKTSPDWNELVRKAARIGTPRLWETAEDTAAPKLAQKLRGRADESFTEMVSHSDEWGHLVLLMKVLKELGAKPLFISLPINANAFEMAGVKPSELGYYYARLRNTAGDFHYPVVTSEDEENQPYFFGDSLGHPSSMGWMIINRTINQFYHGKLPATLD
jgi:D-alanine transfer protein